MVFSFKTFFSQMDHATVWNLKLGVGELFQAVMSPTVPGREQ